MFKRILIANRGEIAVRILRTCREMGIESVVLYDASDMGSLHVRLADRCVRIPTAETFMDGMAILRIAQEQQVDAIHPGYGYLAEEQSFVEACTELGIVLIGPPAAVLWQTRQKLDAIQKVQAAGYLTVACSARAYERAELPELQRDAAALGYPLVVKSCRGGRGRGARVIRSAEMLEHAIQQAQKTSHEVFRNSQVYLEKAIWPAHMIGVQILADAQGNMVHLGEREGSIIYHNQKVLQESPAPFMTEEAREVLCRTALEIARLFDYQNAGTVEFLVDRNGRFYFSEIKGRIQVDHPLTEMRSGIDLVREQIRLAAGEPLGMTQEDVHLRGWALLCRLNAEDPWQQFLPSPGQLLRMRVPTGAHIRVDTYAYSGCHVPTAYDSLFAKLSVWAPDRATAVARLRRALADFALAGIPTNMPLMQQLTEEPSFVNGRYHAGSLSEPAIVDSPETDDLLALAVAAAIRYVQRHQTLNPTVPERMLSGWHRDSRRLG